MIKRIFFILISICFLGCFKYEKVDLVVHNAKIYTADESFITYEAMAIKNKKIVELGKEYEILNKYRSSESYDAQGRTILPGLIDAHSHFSGFAENLVSINLNNTPTFNHLLMYLSKEKDKKAIVGYGWTDENWKLDSNISYRKKLDQIQSDRPIFLWKKDGHSIMVNTDLLHKANIYKDTLIQGGKIDFEKGIVYDEAISVFTQLLPKPSNDELEIALVETQHKCFANGLTTVTDAGINLKQYQLLKQLANKEKLKITIDVMLDANTINLDSCIEKGMDTSGNIRLTGFKFYADGSFGSKTALLKKAYKNQDGYYGLSRLDSNFSEKLQKIVPSSFKVAIHCIGDSAVSFVIEKYIEALGGYEKKNWRLEHIQLIDDVDIHKMPPYGIIPSVQPTHLISDYKQFINDFDSLDWKKAYRWASIYDVVGLMAIGSDFPVENINPFRTFYALISRNNYEGESIFGEYEKLSREEALILMTKNNAKILGLESQTGELRIGYNADFIIINQNIMEVNAGLIPNTQVMATFKNGEKVYEF